ncbi:anti-anti-sigma factor [Breoghania corrubedonensis]|uniref:Anti-anti-sigma factor n=1 Tax=Breoghania corrubedonensis TaxID=665038 RepID=A0A2T5UUC7_9HYPH|nr:STAS domain-containing protein [Breoghania corrubedonensis]PTW55061.1 anti-anti-sigma factor [Breoghania corrubedonensis]
MNAQTSQTGQTHHIKLSGRLVFSDHAEFRHLLNQITAAKVESCIIDLSELQSIDSSGLGMFMVALETGKENGWSLTLRSPQGHVKALIELGKFDKLLNVEK